MEVGHNPRKVLELQAVVLLVAVAFFEERMDNSVPDRVEGDLRNREQVSSVQKALAFNVQLLKPLKEPGNLLFRKPSLLLNNCESL